MTIAKGSRVQRVDAQLRAVFALEPPGWTRLEPQSVSGDPTPGIEARVFDPLWMLVRQWQLGEFSAEDAGSPVAVTAETQTVDVTAWQPPDRDSRWDRPARPLAPGELLEPLVQRERIAAPRIGLRQRAEAGAQFLTQVDGLGVDVAGVLADCPLEPPPEGVPENRAAIELASVVVGRVPDGERVAAALEAGLAAEPQALPAWFAAVADEAAALAAASEWLRWYRGQVAPAPDPDGDCWIEDRLEYRFRIGAGPHVFEAPAFEGGRVDWHHFVAAPQGTPALVPAGDEPAVRSTTLLATPLRFAGMPADRYWQFEDGQVNLGALEVQTHDVARLLLVEFATVYGSDWLTVPLDVPGGSFTTVRSVEYTTTFGETIAVPAADDSGRSGRFRLFRMSVKDSDATIDGLLVAPAVVGLSDGGALEEVLFLRDEMANMAWAVERTVEDPAGDPRSRRDEGYPAPFQSDDAPGAELDYLLQNEVPAWWIPVLPVSTGYRTIALRKGAMVVDGAPVEPRGVLLRPGEPLVVRDEEVPREGVRVRRIPSLARLVDGGYARWIARRATVGRGEGASSLAFDSAIARKKKP
ncbi:MAG: hypothetical protein QOJ35_3506 [Solirubrobacteraceae bacterium]|nr:hypothetical protein [Solirubrobacteraceae bacterium]